MRTCQLQNTFGIDSLSIVDQPVPAVGPGQVLVRMTAWSLNYRDLMTVTGTYNPKMKLPVTPLSDGVGEVIEVGAGVTRVTAGDRVAGIFMEDWINGELNAAAAKSARGGAIPGQLAEYVVMKADGVVLVPEHLSDEEAATLPCAAVTAWHGLVTDGDITADDIVLTLGTGGVSLFAAQFAIAIGAKVIGTSGSDEKLQRLRDLGVSDTINYRKTPDWSARVLELTRGTGVDHVVEVGGAGTLPQSLQAVRMGGQISLIGVLSEPGSAINPIPILMKGVRVQGIYVGSRVMFESMNTFIAKHKLRPVVDRVFAFDDVREAFRHMQSGAHFGKIVIRH
ncbi:MAG: NAD(P)-dependent alcohol dehydrogenase [Planctomycetaceae bacterium]